MSFPAVLKSDKDSENVVQAAVDFMLSLEQDNFNYAPAMDEVTRRRPEKEELVHWCHGAPGAFYIEWNIGVTALFLHFSSAEFYKALCVCHVVYLLATEYSFSMKK